MTLSPRELGHVLAGLRLLQEHSMTPDIWRIATDAGEFDLMTEEEIDRLCESLNSEDNLR